MINSKFIVNVDPNIMLYNETYYLVISNILGFNNSPAHALFIKINDKIFKEDNDLQIFFHSLTQSKSIDELSELIADGIPNEFVLGRDYFLSCSLWNYFMNYNNDNPYKIIKENADDYRLPDYFDDQYNRINEILYIDVADTNLRYFYDINKIKDFEFTIEELKNFVSTFCGIILDNTKFTNIVDTKNLIYKYVLEYFRNNLKDNTSIALDLIFNNTILNDTNAKNSCCNNIQNSTNNEITNMISIIGTSGATNISCKEIYEKSMLAYLIKMLGDHNFYCDWFFIEFNENIDPTPNLVLIKKLKKLFEEFRELGYALYWGSGDDNCGCSHRNLSNNSSILNISKENYVIFENYYKVLLYNENDEVCENKNKIKIYGESFGTILPYIYYV